MPQKKGAQIPYKTFGKGHRAVIFIHGFMDGGVIWDYVIAGLSAPGFFLVNLDLPGMGDMSDWEGCFDLRTLAAAVASVLEEIALPAVLVGHSMGAQVAELVARNRPENVAGMVLLTPIPLEGLPVEEAVAAHMRSIGGDEKKQRENRMQYCPNLTSAQLESLVNSSMKVKPEVSRKLFETWSEGDLIGKEPFPGNIPILVISGEQDPFAPPALIKDKILPHFAGAKTKIIQGASHWPHVVCAPAVIKLLGDFLAQFG